MCNLPDYRCLDCGEVIHHEGLCDSCQKEADVQALIMADQAIEDYEWEQQIADIADFRATAGGR